MGCELKFLATKEDLVGKRILRAAKVGIGFGLVFEGGEIAVFETVHDYEEPACVEIDEEPRLSAYDKENLGLITRAERVQIEQMELRELVARLEAYARRDYEILKKRFDP